LKIRCSDATTSFTVTGLPSENLIPLRSLKTHVLPPFVGLGRFSARSGTTVNAELPPAFVKPSSPS
jgi:hypothetical protein